jgi:hypothetical protein
LSVAPERAALIVSVVPLTETSFTPGAVGLAARLFAYYEGYRPLIYFIGGLLPLVPGGMATRGLATGDGAVAGCAADYGTTLAAQQLEIFVQAVGDFAREAGALDATLRTECTAIANDLGATAVDFVPTGVETPTAVACRVAAQRLRGEFQALRGAAGLTVGLTK